MNLQRFGQLQLQLGNSPETDSGVESFLVYRSNPWPTGQAAISADNMLSVGRGLNGKYFSDKSLAIRFAYSATICRNSAMMSFLLAIHEQCKIAKSNPISVHWRERFLTFFWLTLKSTRPVFVRTSSVWQPRSQATPKSAATGFDRCKKVCR